MAIEGVEQPAYIQIEDDLRLRRYDGTADFALDWYQDEELVILVDGVKRPYDRNTLYSMYNYLDAHGEVYFIEVLENVLEHLVFNLSCLLMKYQKAGFISVLRRMLGNLFCRKPEIKL